jgi:hypothetical protein
MANQKVAITAEKPPDSLGFVVVIDVEILAGTTRVNRSTDCAFSALCQKQFAVLLHGYAIRFSEVIAAFKSLDLFGVPTLIVPHNFPGEFTIICPPISSPFGIARLAPALRSAMFTLTNWTRFHVPVTVTNCHSLSIFVTKCNAILP